MKKQDEDSLSSTGSLENALQLDVDKFESVSLIAADKTVIERAPKMTILQAALAIVAAVVGGGLLGIPFAFYRFGLFLGITMLILITILAHFSSMMYMKIKDLTPRRYESIYEIAYLLIGRASIFILCTIMTFAISGFCVLLYFALGEIISQLIIPSNIDHELIQDSDTERELDIIE